MSPEPEFRWRNAAVAIVSHSSGGGQKTGTGMLVTKNLVLTAAHVVCHQDCAGPVRVRWKSDSQDFGPASGDRGNGFHNATETAPGDRGILWSCDELDLALISCASPPEVHPVPVANCTITEGAAWSAEAYPRIGENSLEVSKWINGTCSAVDGAGKHSRFQLQGMQLVRAEENSEGAQWSGASGAAITIEIDGQQKVSGVLIQENVQFQTSLTAVPLLEACKDPVFQAHVSGHAEESGSWQDFEPDQSTSEAWQDAYRKQLDQALERVPETAWSRLMAECPMLGPYPSEAHQRAEAMTRLIDLAQGVLQNALAKMINGLQQEGQARDAELVRDLLFTIAPCTSRPESRRFIAWMRDKKGRVSLEAVAGTPTKADVIAAGIDADKVRLATRKTPMDLPAGLTRIPYPPRAGIDPDGEAYIAAICNFLAGQAAPDALADDLVSYVLQTEAQGAQTSLERLRRYLQRRRDIDGERSFYLTVPAATLLNAHQRTRLLSALSTLMERVQEIRVLAIDTSWIDEDDEEIGALAHAVPVVSKDGG